MCVKYRNQNKKKENIMKVPLMARHLTCCLNLDLLVHRFLKQHIKQDQ